MKNKNIIAFDELAFKSSGDLKWYLSCGCEIEFIWNGKYYSITHPNGIIDIGEGYYLDNGKAYNVLSGTEYDVNDRLQSDNVDDILNFKLESDRLRDIVTQIGICI